MSTFRSASAPGDRSTVRTFNVRSSGRDLAAVRRPRIVNVSLPAKGDVDTEAPAPEPKKNAEPKASAAKPAKNDATVKVSDG